MRQIKAIQGKADQVRFLKRDKPVGLYRIAYKATIPYQYRQDGRPWSAIRTVTYLDNIHVSITSSLNEVQQAVILHMQDKS